MTTRSALQQLASDRLGEDVGAWIARHRPQPDGAMISYRGLSLILLQQHRIGVTAETLRQWDPSPRPSPAGGPSGTTQSPDGSAAPTADRRRADPA